MFCLCVLSLQGSDDGPYQPFYPDLTSSSSYGSQIDIHGKGGRGKVRHYDWNSVHFFPDIHDVDSPTPPITYSKRPIEKSPKDWESTKQEMAALVLETEKELNQMLADMEYNLSDEENHPPKRKERGVLLQQRSAPHQIQDHEPVTTDSDADSYADSPKVWRKNPMHVNKKRRDDRHRSTEARYITYEGDSPVQIRRRQNSGSPAFRERDRDGSRKMRSGKRVSGPLTEQQHYLKKDGGTKVKRKNSDIQEKYQKFEELQQRRRALDSTSEEDLPVLSRASERGSHHVPSQAIRDGKRRHSEPKLEPLIMESFRNAPGSAKLPRASYPQASDEEDLYYEQGQDLPPDQERVEEQIGHQQFKMRLKQFEQMGSTEPRPSPRGPRRFREPTPEQLLQQFQHEQQQRMEKLRHDEYQKELQEKQLQRQKEEYKSQLEKQHEYRKHQEEQKQQAQRPTQSSPQQGTPQLYDKVRLRKAPPSQAPMSSHEFHFDQKQVSSTFDNKEVLSDERDDSGYHSHEQKQWSENWRKDNELPPDSQQHLRYSQLLKETPDFSAEYPIEKFETEQYRNISSSFENLYDGVDLSMYSPPMDEVDFGRGHQMYGDDSYQGSHDPYSKNGHHYHDPRQPPGGHPETPPSGHTEALPSGQPGERTDHPGFGHEDYRDQWAREIAETNFQMDGQSHEDRQRMTKDYDAKALIEEENKKYQEYKADYARAHPQSPEGYSKKSPFSHVKYGSEPAPQSEQMSKIHHERQQALYGDQPPPVSENQPRSWVRDYARPLSSGDYPGSYPGVLRRSQEDLRLERSEEQYTEQRKSNKEWLARDLRKYRESPDRRQSDSQQRYGESPSGQHRQYDERPSSGDLERHHDNVPFDPEAGQYRRRISPNRHADSPVHGTPDSGQYRRQGDPSLKHPESPMRHSQSPAPLPLDSRQYRRRDSPLRHPNSPMRHSEATPPFPSESGQYRRRASPVKHQESPESNQHQWSRSPVKHYDSPTRQTPENGQYRRPGSPVKHHESPTRQALENGQYRRQANSPMRHQGSPLRHSRDSPQRRRPESMMDHRRPAEPMVNNHQRPRSLERGDRQSAPPGGQTWYEYSNDSFHAYERESEKRVQGRREQKARMEAKQQHRPDVVEQLWGGLQYSESYPTNKNRDDKSPYHKENNNLPDVARTFAAHQPAPRQSSSNNERRPSPGQGQPQEKRPSSGQGYSPDHRYDPDRHTSASPPKPPRTYNEQRATQPLTAQKENHSHPGQLLEREEVVMPVNQAPLRSSVSNQAPMSPQQYYQKPETERGPSTKDFLAEAGVYFTKDENPKTQWNYSNAYETQDTKTAPLPPPDYTKGPPRMKTDDGAYVDLRDIQHNKRQNGIGSSPRSPDIGSERMSRKDDHYRQEVAFSVTGVKKEPVVDRSRPPRHPATTSLQVKLQRSPSAGSERRDDGKIVPPLRRPRSPSAETRPRPHRPPLVIRSRSYGDINDIEKVPKVDLMSIKSNLFGQEGEKLEQQYQQRSDLARLQDRKDRKVSELKAGVFNIPDETVPVVISRLSHPSSRNFDDNNDERIFDYASFRDKEKRKRPNIQDVLTDLEKTFEALDLDMDEDLLPRNHFPSSSSDPTNVKRLSITNLKKLEELQNNQQTPSMDYARQWLSHEKLPQSDREAESQDAKSRPGVSPESMEVANYSYAIRLRSSSIPDSRSQSIVSEGRRSASARIPYPRKVADDMAYRRQNNSLPYRQGSQSGGSCRAHSPGVTPAQSVDSLSKTFRSRTPDTVYDDLYRTRSLSSSRQEVVSPSAEIKAMPSPTSTDYLKERTTIPMRSRMRIRPERESDMYHDDQAYRRLRKDVPPVKAELPQRYLKRRQEMLLSHQRSRSLERPPERKQRAERLSIPRNDERRSSLGSASSLSQERRNSLSKGVACMVEKFESPLRISYSAPNLTDNSVFSNSYTNGEFDPQTSRQTSKHINKRLQTPRIVKQRHEMRVKIKHLKSGNDSYIYAVDSESDLSSVGVDGHVGSGRHDRSPPDGAFSDEQDIKSRLTASAEDLQNVMKISHAQPVQMTELQPEIPEPEPMKITQYLTKEMFIMQEPKKDKRQISVEVPVQHVSKIGQDKSDNHSSEFTTSLFDSCQRSISESSKDQMSTSFSKIQQPKSFELTKPKPFELTKPKAFESQIKRDMKNHSINVKHENTVSNVEGQKGYFRSSFQKEDRSSVPKSKEIPRVPRIPDSRMSQSKITKNVESESWQDTNVDVKMQKSLSTSASWHQTAKETRSEVTETVTSSGHVKEPSSKLVTASITSSGHAQKGTSSKLNERVNQDMFRAQMTFDTFPSHSSDSSSSESQNHQKKMVMSNEGKSVQLKRHDVEKEMVTHMKEQKVKDQVSRSSASQITQKVEGQVSRSLSSQVTTSYVMSSSTKQVMKSTTQEHRKKQVAVFSKSKRHPDREPGIPFSPLMDLKDDSYDTLDVLVANQPTEGSADELDFYSDYDNFEEETDQDDNQTDILVEEQKESQMKTVEVSAENVAMPAYEMDDEAKESDEEAPKLRDRKKKLIPKERRRSIKELVDTFESQVTFPFMKNKPLRKCSSHESVRGESETEGHNLKDLSGSVPNLHDKGQGHGESVKQRSLSSQAMMGDVVSDW